MITQATKDKIRQLYTEGKTITVITACAGISRTSVQKILFPERFAKHRAKQNHPFYTKMKTFQGKVSVSKATFTLDDLLTCIGENPVCYLTGVPINIYDKASYSFDHIIPKCLGGTNNLDNLGICTAKANMMKLSMLKYEMIEECKRILSHHGYTVSI